MPVLARWTAPRSIRTAARAPGVAGFVAGFVPGFVTLLVALVPAHAAADSVQIDLQLNPERGFQVIQELSYEAIVVGTDGYRADLHLRVALHNASSRQQDTVLSLALPRGAEIHGLRVARNGVWTPGIAAGIASEPARREPGTVFVRPLAPVSDGDLPGAEVVAFSLEPATTTQIELALKVPIRLRGDRWELDLPARGEALEGLASQRRVLVKPPTNPRAPALAPRFWVDGNSNAGQPFLVTHPEDRVTVSWPKEQVAKASSQSPLEAHLAVSPDQPRSKSGRFTLYLRLGSAPPPRPDHLLIIVDRSRSTTPSMHREAVAAVDALLDTLPATLTFDAISFARTARPLLPDGPTFPGVHDRAARQQVALALDASAREQGTDLAAALALAGQRISKRGAKRPLLLVITDGMLPLGAGPESLGRVFADNLGPRGNAEPPQILFLVDEPLLMRTGIAPDHPIAILAAGLDARINLISLLSLISPTSPTDTTVATNLLRAPGVLRELDISLPPQAVLEDSPPTGLVAGSVLALAGTYQHGPPHLRVRGKLGPTRPQLRPRPELMPAPPPALVASTRPTGLAQAALEGFATPPWYGRRYQRSAQLAITWAGRGRATDRGHLDDKIFRRYLGIRVFPRARVCYNQALARAQQLGGRVLFEFEVGKGEVMLATADTTGLNQRDPAFDRCLLEAAWMLDIPAGHLDDQIYRVRYPLVFNPPKTGRPPLDDGVMGPGTVELLLNLQR